MLIRDLIERNEIPVDIDQRLLDIYFSLDETDSSLWECIQQHFFLTNQVSELTAKYNSACRLPNDDLSRFIKSTKLINGLTLEEFIVHNDRLFTKKVSFGTDSIRFIDTWIDDEDDEDVDDEDDEDELDELERELISNDEKEKADEDVELNELERELISNDEKEKADEDVELEELEREFIPNDEKGKADEDF
jgi:hypothetical protein